MKNNNTGISLNDEEAKVLGFLLDPSTNSSRNYDDSFSSRSPEGEPLIVSYYHTSSPETNRDVSVLDVAAYILKRLGRISTMKLQKLVYYCQAWSLVWDEVPLFVEPIEAWANGPVVRELFNYHRGMYEVEKVLTGNPELISPGQVETINSVIDFYGKKSAQWLIELSHSEEPWKKARRGLPATSRGSRPISLSGMAEYYSSL